LSTWVNVFSALSFFLEEIIIEAVTLTSPDESRVLPNNEDILSLVQLAENSSLVGSMLLEEAANVSNDITSTSKIASKNLRLALSGREIVRFNS